MALVPSHLKHHEHALEADPELASETPSLISKVKSWLTPHTEGDVDGYKHEHGRRYHGHQAGKYLQPNDSEEQDRLNLHHDVFGLQHGSLHRAPIDSNMKRALDLGCGTGRWAMEFAEQNPGAEVIGVDLSPIQPRTPPKNCKFFVGDMESEWEWSPEEAFDYIHLRGMSGTVADWSHLYKKILQHLKPGGWAEIQEYQCWLSSDEDLELTKAPQIKRWQALVDKASIKFGKRFNIAEKQKEWMSEAGFAEVKDDTFKVPVGSWAKDPKFKEIGKLQQEHMILCVESFTLALLTRVQGMQREEVEKLIDGVKSEFRDPNQRLITVFHWVYGRKPGS